MSAGSTGSDRPFGDDDLLPISALQHLLFCERQAALIHVEQVWAENELTVQGQQLHRRADSGKAEALRGRGKGVRAERAVLLRCRRLGVWGKADVVEYRRAGGADAAGGPPGFGEVPLPVEYKRGKPKADHSDAVQLAAQALALEEMHGVPVPAGAIFYGRTRERVTIEIDAPLRARTEAAAARLHELVRAGHTPAAALQRKCKKCSLLHLCQPSAIGRKRGQRRSAAAFAARALAAAFAEEPAGDRLEEAQ